MEEVRIYITEQRGETAVGNGWVRSTLNYGSYASPHRNPIGRLLHVNEWLGRSGQAFTLPLPAQSISVFIPLAGEIALRIKKQEYAIPLGSLLVLPVDAEAAVSVQQLAANEGYFAFQQLVFSMEGWCSNGIRSYTLPIADASGQNRLLPVFERGEMPFQVYIGAFSGKSEYNLALDTTFDHTFALTLDGNFEVEERLLFPGDGLSLRKLQKLEAECLSATGLLLVLHF